MSNSTSVDRVSLFRSAYVPVQTGIKVVKREALGTVTKST